MGILNGAENLRIKSQYGNRSVDVDIERGLINYEDGDLLSPAAAERAGRIYQKFKDSDVPSLRRVAERLGNMKSINQETGRPLKVATTSAAEVDLRSTAAMNEDLMFCNDGTVDKRCAAFKQGRALTREDGHLDQRSEIGEAKIKPSASSSFSTHTSSSPSRGGSDDGDVDSGSVIGNGGDSGTSNGDDSGSVGGSSEDQTCVLSYTRQDGTEVSGYYRKIGLVDRE